jgi:hypothetical protein
MLDWLFDFIQWVWDWLAAGIYDFFVAAAAYVSLVSFKIWLKFQFFLLDVGFKLYTDFLESLNISDYLQDKYNSLDSGVLSVLAFFRVPEGLTLIFNAIGTKIALRFIPFSGVK